METIKPFVVLEGVDGSGKTTVGQRLAHELGGAYLHTLSEGYKPSRAYVDTSAPDARLLFYLSSVVDASERIAQMRLEQPVICDRYVWSSLVPHAAYHGRDLSELTQVWSFVTNALVSPSQVFFLQVSEEEQLRRIGTRKDLTLSASDSFCLQEVYRKNVRRLYEQVAHRMCVCVG